jgi:molybdenum cofactor guanylyltransferase
LGRPCAAHLVIAPSAVTGIVLAGGRGTRMGGADKGLELFNGVPLALHALHRLAPQVGPLLLNANRNTAAYTALGAPLNAPVVPDSEPADHAGPLAGFITGLAHCTTPYLLTVPCDTPLFPLDLAERLAASLADGRNELAVACASDERGELRMQPVFCLMRANVLASLQDFTRNGGRKVGAWMAQHATARVAFERAIDAGVFANANTLDELHSLQTMPAQAAAAP